MNLSYGNVADMNFSYGNIALEDAWSNMRQRRKHLLSKADEQIRGVSLFL